MTKDIFSDLVLPSDDDIKKETQWARISLSKQGKFLPEMVKQKMSLIKKGKDPNNKGKPRKVKRQISQETREKISKTLKGVVHSEESNSKKSLTMQGKLKPKIICPYCGKEGGKPVMMKWHFDNCKLK